MNTRILTSTAAALLAWIAGAPLLPGFRAQDEEHEETELEEHMHRVEDSMRELRRSVRDDANRSTSLALVQRIQGETLAAKALVPSMAATVPEAERAAFIADFRRTMIDFLEAQLELERAIVDGDVEAAREAFGQVHDFEDRGHERFTEDEDE